MYVTFRRLFSSFSFRDLPKQLTAPQNRRMIAMVAGSFGAGATFTAYAWHLNRLSLTPQQDQDHNTTQQVQNQLDLLSRHPYAAPYFNKAGDIKKQCEEFKISPDVRIMMENNLTKVDMRKIGKQIARKDADDITPPNAAFVVDPSCTFGDEAMKLAQITRPNAISLLSYNLYKQISTLMPTMNIEKGVWIYVYPEIDEENNGIKLIKTIKVVVEKSEKDLIDNIHHKGLHEIRDGYYNCLGFEFNFLAVFNHLHSNSLQSDAEIHLQLSKHQYKAKINSSSFEIGLPY